MEDLKFGITFRFKERYLPSKRHRKPRERELAACRDISVRMPGEDEFPVAMEVIEYGNYGGEFRIGKKEVRAYGGRLYRMAVDNMGVPKDAGHIRWQLELAASGVWMEFSQEPGRGLGLPDGKVKLGDDLQARTRAMEETAMDCIMFRGNAWEACGEPRYRITTYGLGHNHGGSSLSVDWGYNPNIAPGAYFRADRRDEALAEFKRTALGRGDTEYADMYDKDPVIKVLMPDYVRLDPQRDHAGGGDPFIMGLESMISRTSSAAEAGLIAMAAAISEASAAKGGAV